MHQLSSFCLYFDSRRKHELDFLLQLACSSLTPRCFIEAPRCIHDLVHSEFPVSDLPCWTVLIMISATVIGLRSLEGDVFRQFLTQKNAKLFSISGIWDINKKERKISGVALNLLDTEEQRMIMATRCKLSGLSLRLTRDLFFYEHILGTMTCPIYN